LDVIPETTDLAPYAARLDALLIADMNKPRGERSIGNIAAEIARLLRILRDMPPEVTFADAPFERAYERMEAALSQAFTVLSVENRPSALVDLLEAGIRHDALADQFDLTPAVDWSGTRLTNVVSRLAAVGPGQKAWHELCRAVELMLAEAERLDDVNDQVKRLRYLNQVTALLPASRATAVALWNDEETRRNTNPALKRGGHVYAGRHSHHRRARGN
jgi:hypothetical protein